MEREREVERERERVGRRGEMSEENINRKLAQKNINYGFENFDCNFRLSH